MTHGVVLGIRHLFEQGTCDAMLASVTHGRMLTRGAIHDEAWRVAAVLIRLGIAPGDCIR